MNEKLLEILKDVEIKTLTPMEAHKKICVLFGVGECFHPSTYWCWGNEERTIKHCAWCGAKNIR